MENSIIDLIDNVKGGDNVKAGKQFDGIMAQKLQDALDAKKIEIASSMCKKSSDNEEE